MNYREEIMDHFRNPRGKGRVEDMPVWVEESNASCGDKLRIGVRVEDGVIEDIVWEGEGCAISQASMSMLVEKVKGMNLESVKGLGDKGVEEMLGGEINTGRKKCVSLGYRGLLAVFDKYGLV